ncbi:MAG: TIGR01777 family oxidoreductase [Terrimesophilobacter sp.]
MAQPARASGPTRILISGASGLIGTELVRQLRQDGHVVSTLVRRQPHAPGEHNWAPGAGLLDTRLIDEADAVINLSGASLQRLPWTRAYKKEIVQSRVRATRTLADAMNLSDRPPAVFLSASAVGIYGDRPGERLDESSSPGDGFLADVVTAWEEAASLAPVTSRLVLFRTGLVIARAGALAPLTTLTRFGLGPGIGTGGDVWPWISLYDEAAAIRHALTSSLSGVVNLVGPTPATSDRITRILALAMHRPHLFRIPEWTMTLALQDAAKQLLLSSRKIVPDKLLSDGFRFRHPTVEQAIGAALPD